MPDAYDRGTFQRLAEIRLSEAKLLAEQGYPSGAYYLAAYAVECALKAHIAAQFKENQIPDKAFVNDIYTHDLKKPIRLAGLEAELDSARQADAGFRQSWTIVEGWTEQARHEVWTQEAASAIIDAVAGSKDAKGIFQWLTSHW
jgi:HEPN domain-containing protein